MAILKDLIVHGSSRFLNKIYASELETPLIEAEAGIIKKLKADSATVVGLLDVKGQLHTNSWSNSNIATIDGNFYITPTIGSGEGTIAITSSDLTFTRKDTNNSFAVESSLYLGDNSSITWPSYSKVLVTGQVKLNGEWIPLGTLLGQISGVATAASITINNIKDNKNQTSNVYTTLVNSGINSTDYRNLKVSLYQRASSSTAFYPLGIYMTAIGTNGKTFLDIYGGIKALSNSNIYGGFAEPNVRIGNLQGLPNVGGQTPSGWGIYTDNGYFKGIIAADKGYIGSGSRYWVIANYEDGSNPNNSRSYIYSYNGTDNGTDSVTSTVEGIYLGTDGIRNYKDSTHYVTIKNGVISALGVDLTGQITATSGTIGGWNIGTDTNKSLYYGNQTPGATTTNLVLSPTSAINSNAIGGSATGLNWFLSAGKVFGVTTAGALYATSGKIGGFDIGTTYIKNGKTSYNETTNDGVYLGINGIGLGKGKFYVTQAGALTATSGHIGGWQIGNTALSIGAWGEEDSALICIGSGTEKSIGGSDEISGWVFTAGDKFGVTKTGALYASSANISGKITAISGTIGGIEIVDGNLNVSSISIGDLKYGENYLDNLSPFFSHSPYLVGDYWQAWSRHNGYTYTNMGDGWMRVQYTNTTSSVVRRDFRPFINRRIKEGVDYTFLIEFRNNHSTGNATGTDFYIVENNNCQFWGSVIKKNIEGAGNFTTTNIINDVSKNTTDIYTKRFIKVSEATGSSHWTNGSIDKVNGLVTFTTRCGANTTIDYEVRVSIYEGKYLGDYKPSTDSINGWNVLINVSTIDYLSNTATLHATVYKDGIVQTSGFTLQWYKTVTNTSITPQDTTTTLISGETTNTLNVTGLNALDASYTCIVS